MDVPVPDAFARQHAPPKGGLDPGLPGQEAGTPGHPYVRLRVSGTEAAETRSPAEPADTVAATEIDPTPQLPTFCMLDTMRTFNS